MSSLYVVDPHIGKLREEARRVYSLDDKRKRDASNAFMAIGAVLISLCLYIGYLIGRA